MPQRTPSSLQVRRRRDCMPNHQSSAHPILPVPGTRHTLVVPQLVRPSFACALRAHAYLLVARMWGLVGPTPLWRPFGFVNCLIRQVTNRPSVHACDMLSHTGGGTSTVAPDPERRPSRPTVQLLASHQPLQRMHAHAIIAQSVRHTDSAIERKESHLPSGPASCGTAISTGRPRSRRATARSASLISWKREGTSAGFDSEGT